jgi:hypothetical protein
MKVMLLVNLKTVGGRVVPKGSVFSDEYKPLPGFIARKIGTYMVQVLEDKPKYEIVDPDDFTMEEPEPKLEETMRYVEPVEFVKAIPEVEEVFETTEELSQFEEEIKEEEEEPEEEIKEEEEEPEEEIKEEVPKKRCLKKKTDEERSSKPKKRKGRSKKVN